MWCNIWLGECKKSSLYALHKQQSKVKTHYNTLQPDGFSMGTLFPTIFPYLHMYIHSNLQTHWCCRCSWAVKVNVLTACILLTHFLMEIFLLVFTDLFRKLIPQPLLQPLSPFFPWSCQKRIQPSCQCGFLNVYLFSCMIVLIHLDQISSQLQAASSRRISC